MKNAIIFSAIIACLGLADARSFAQTAGPVHQPLTAALDAKLGSGPEGTYSRTCGYCHGTNVGPILLGKGYPAEAVAFMVRNGKGAMPAFRTSEISKAELDALSVWIAKSKATVADHGK